jgi:ATP-binding protein involved in chromosome partitioning
MNETCTHNCETCGKTCKDRKKDQTDFKVECNALSQIKHTVAVVSGKGGVGKSLITSLLGVLLRRKGFETGILDADITGPSIPKIFGAEAFKPEVCEEGFFPVESKSGVKLISINLLIPDADAPVIWRGPLITGTIKQFYTDVIWGPLDYLLIDMPPGTGDVPLTVFQSIPLDGIIIVTSPQDLVSLIVKKAVNMAKTMKIPVLGLVENFSYAVCPDCGKTFDLFGKSKAEEKAKEMGIPFLGRLPIEPKLAELCDRGEIELAPEGYLNGAVEVLEKL